MKKRYYIRHPSSIPIDAQPIDKSSGIDHTSLVNISGGGLAFQSHTLLPIGKKVRIQIPSMDCSFRATGQVAWIKKEAQGCTVGIVFTDKSEAFHVRMIEQICHIESYRKQNMKKGRNISIEKATSEWIEHFAADFPQLY
ncbi:PilZ domain-containing protein [Mariprofundus aestuarium]|nr:PilZ domain-containing protein [Mariprofundus aestuarium]